MKYHNYKDHDKYLAYLRRYREKTGSNKYEMRKYTAEEDRLILNPITSDRELGIRLQRSVKAIQQRRRRLRNIGN